MARIREALRQADQRRNRLTETVPAPRPYHPDEEMPSLVPEGDEIPFIEVGGGRQSTQASASVLASNSETATKRAIPDGEQKRVLSPPEVPVPATSAVTTRFPGVTFRPWPSEIPTLRPAPERFAPELVALYHPGHPVSEQYRSLITHLPVAQPARQSQVLLFTAATPQTETTTILLNIAITWARQGKAHVALVDANLRRPSVAERLGLPPAPGLRDVLAGTVSLQCALQETGQANLAALTAGRAGDGCTGMLASEAMRAVLRHLRGRFEWVLVDAPCWDGRPEVVALGSACDAIYLILPEAEAETPEVADLMEVISQQGSSLRGCILTR
jgi:Mrp family chromosome partitioning ATPase